LDFDSLTTWDGRLHWWVLAATLGRSALAKMAHRVVRNRWMSDVSRENVDSLKGSMEKGPKLTFGLFLFYAFTPLLSNFVFIALRANDHAPGETGDSVFLGPICQLCLLDSERSRGIAQV
jgi:hypothetical protein